MPARTVTLGVVAVTELANRQIQATGRYFDDLRSKNPVELEVKLNRLQAIAESKIIAKEMAQTVKDTIKLDTSGVGDKLQKLADSMKKGGGPWWLGPGLLGLGSITTLAGVASAAVIGLGGAFIAGAGALAAFGAVAKPVLSDALKAQQQVNTAQNNYQAAIAAGVKPAAAYRAEQIAIGRAYADLSPAQIKLSQQLGSMAQAWQNVKASFTPLIAGSLQPWLAGITTGIGNLGLVIKPMAPIIAQLGTEFGILMSSSAFKDFMRFLGTTGSAVVQSAGSAIINLITGLITLLPKFSPLILDAAFGISKWSNAFLAWASSKKASDQIQSFLEWVHDNGPLVKTLLENLGGALKALAPGLASGGLLELKVVSDFLGFIARLPPKLAAPLAEVAGALLLLNKLGVISVGLKLLGTGAADAAAAGGAAGLWGRMLPGVRLVAGALVATVVVAMVLKSISSGPGGKNWWDNPFGGDPTSKDPNKQGISTWVGLGHQIEKAWSDTWLAVRHAAQQAFDQIVIQALKMALGITGAFGLLPSFLGAPFRKAHQAIQNELDRIQGNASTTVSNIRSYWLGLNGLVTNLILNITTAGQGPIPGKTFPRGFASGTASAAPGWAWVGEKGAELVHFTGGEQVVPSGVARGYAGGTGGGRAASVTITVAGTPRNEADAFMVSWLKRLIASGQLSVQMAP